MRHSALHSRLTLALTVLTGPAVFVAPALAQCSPPVLDSQNGFVTIRGVASEGNFVYVSDGLNGLVTLDVTDPANVQVSSVFSLGGFYRGATVDEGVAYVATAASFQALDVSTPSTPTLLGTSIGSVQVFDVEAGVAYLASGASDLRFADVSDPTTITLLGQFTQAGVIRDLRVEDGLVFGVYGDAGLRILDATDPANPIQIGAASSLGFAHRIEVQDGLAYIVDQDFGMRIVDVSDPTQPSEVGSFPIAAQPESIEVSEQLAFVGTANAGIQVIEILDASAPVLVGSAASQGTDLQLHLVGDVLFSGTSADSVRAYSVSSCLHPLGASYCTDAVDNSTGQPGRVIGLGSFVSSLNNVQVYAVDLPPAAASYVLGSQAQGFVAMPGGSQGNLCLGGQIARFSSGVMATDVYGNALFPIDLTTIPTSPPQAVQPGQTWNFQVWYRDQNPGQTSNFTDALSVAFF